MAALTLVAGPAASNAGAVVRTPGPSWATCNDEAMAHTPAVVWARIHSASEMRDIPTSFWSDGVYRGDIARIICYESSYEVHASNGAQFGWFQMSPGLVASERVSWGEYWSGAGPHPAGWFQALAGEVYILDRYHTPVAAWEHERDYGWY